MSDLNPTLRFVTKAAKLTDGFIGVCTLGFYDPNWHLDVVRWACKRQASMYIEKVVSDTEVKLTKRRGFPKKRAAVINISKENDLLESEGFPIL